MKEYIVHAPNDNKIAVEEYASFYGEPIRELIRCKDCKHFELNHWENVNGIPLIVAHEICNKWGNGCKTSVDGYCFIAERKEAAAITKGRAKAKNVAEGKKAYTANATVFKVRKEDEPE